MPRESQQPELLDSFLSSIGANSLSTQLSTSNEPQAVVIHEKIQQEIDTVNDSTLALLQDKWDTFHEQLEKGQDILVQLEEEERELSSLEETLDDSSPSAFLPSLISHLESHQSLLAAHAVSTHTVTLLSSLLSLHSTISTLSDSISTGQLYPSAVQHLRESIQAVERGAEDWIEETEVWKGLVKWQGDEQSRLETILQNTFESAFDFTSPSTSHSASVDPTTTMTTSELQLTSNLQAAPNGPILRLFDVLKGLDEFSELTGKQSRVEGLVARVSKQVLRSFVAPFLDSNGTIEWHGDEKEAVEGRKKTNLKFAYPEPTAEGVYKVLLETTTPLEEEQGQGPIDDLSRFLTFFTTHSSLFDPNEPSSRYTALFTASLTPSLQSYLITSHLVPSLPSSTRHLTAYLQLLSRSTSFELTLLPSLNLFAFLPSASTSSEESHILSTWSKSLPQHYARALGERALARVRNQVKNWDWANPDGGEMVDVEVREEEEMEGLLRGLELGLDEDEAKDGGLEQDMEKEQKKRRTELETVPKGAKREMTLEEALAPRPPRVVTPPPPLPPPPREPSPTPQVQLADPPPPTATIGGGRKNKLKLGASKITNPQSVPFLPPRSPSPPPMFQGDDLQLPPPSVTTTTTTEEPSSSPSLPPISTSTSAVQLDPGFTSQQHNRSNSRSSSTGGGQGTPILSPRPISIPSAASFTHAVEHSDEDQVHEIVERAQRTIAEEGKDIFEPLEEVRDDGVEMVVGEKELEKEIEIKMEEEEGEQSQYEGALTREALSHRDEEEQEEKPFIKSEEELEEAESLQTQSLVEIVEPDLEEIKQEEEEEQPVKEEEISNELETTPQVGDYEPTPQPPFPTHSAEFYSQTEYVPPQLYSQANYTPPQFDSLQESTETLGDHSEQYEQQYPDSEQQPDTRYDPQTYEPETPSLPPPVSPTRAPVAEASYYPPPSQSVAPPPPRSSAAVPPPPRAKTLPVNPPPRSATSPMNSIPPPPPRASSAYSPQPPRSQGVLSPPIQPQQNLRPVSPANRSMPVHPPPPGRQVPATSRSPVLHQSTSFDRSQAVSPAPPPPPRSSNSPYAPPPPRQGGVLSPPPPNNNANVQIRASPSYPRQSTAPPAPQTAPAPLTSPFGAFSLSTSSSSSSLRSGVSPRPPSRNQDGPILNHIQQRFVSPPPTHVNPYSSFPVPNSAPAPQSSYIPANDPLLADLFGSGGGGSSKSTAAYFAPDPPGRQQRSNSNSSQGSASNFNRPSSRGSQHQYQPQQYSNATQPLQSQYYQQQNYYGDEVEELEDRYPPNSYGGYGQGQQEAMRLRGGASYLSDSSEDENEEEEHVVLRLRGGASLDLGEMDEDGGDKSGDDWGFGDDAGLEEGGDEDAWGFGGDDEVVESAPPSPPVLRNPPPALPKPASLPPTLASPIRSNFSPPTSPIRPHVVSRAPANTSFVPSHAPSASISSVSSQTSTLSRAPSYSFSSTLAPPINSHTDLEPAVEEETEEGGEGDDAWGFDEELEAESPPLESEEAAEIPPTEIAEPIARPETPPPVVERQRTPSPSPASPKQVIHEIGVGSSNVLPPVSIDSYNPELGVAQETLPESTSEPSPVAQEEVDEWGFDEGDGEEPIEPEPTTEEHSSALVEESLDALADQEPEPVASFESQPEFSHVLPEDDREENETISGQPDEPPIVPSEEVEDVLPAPQASTEPSNVSEVDTVISAEGPIIVNDVESQPEILVESTNESESLPTETPALDNAEAGHFDEEESGWGLDESEQQVDVEEEQPLPSATPALDIAEEGHSIVESDGWDIEEPASPPPPQNEISFTQPSSEDPAVEQEEVSTPTTEAAPTATPALDDAEFGLAPALAHEEEEKVLVEDTESQQVEPAEILPASTPALEQVEEGHGNELELEEEEETSTQLAEPVPQNIELDELTPSVISQPESAVETENNRREPFDDLSESVEVAPVSDAEPTIESQDSEQLRPLSEPLGVESLPHEEADETQLDRSESALTAPAEQLQEQSFPVAVSPEETPTDEVTPAPFRDDYASSAPTPTLPESIGHSDEPVSSHIAQNPIEETLIESVAAPLDDASLLNLEGDGEEEATEVGAEDPWGIEGDEEQAVDSGLTSQETFVPDERASEREEQDLPVEETLLDSAPLDDRFDSTYLDHSRRSSVEDDLSPPHSDTVMVEPMSASNSSGGTHGERNMSSPEVIEKSDAWGFDHEAGEPEGQGAEILEGLDDSHELEKDDEQPVVQHELERPVLHEDSTVQHISERPVVESVSEEESDLLATSVQTQQHTFSPPIESLPEPALEPSDWPGQSTNEVEEKSSMQEEQVSSETPIEDNISRPPSPTPPAPPPAAIEEDATVDDPWDLDLEESADPLEEQATRPLEDSVPTVQEVATEESTEANESVPDQPVQKELDTSPPDTFDVQETGRPQEPLFEEILQPSQEFIETNTGLTEPQAETEEEDEQEEGWGWDESADQDREITPEAESQLEAPSLPEAVPESVSNVEESKEAEETNSSIVAPLVEAAGAVSAIALASTAALGLTSTDQTPSSPPTMARSIEPQESSKASPELAPSSSLETTSAPSQVSTTHDREPSNASAEAEGWGWDGEEEGEEDESTKKSFEPEISKEEVAKDSIPLPEPQSDPTPPAPPVRMEKMMVSRRSREIVKIAEEILVEALNVASPSFEHPQFAAASAPLLSTFVSLLSLYRATAAVHNSTLLASVPAIGMQFANDADWIGREVERVWKSKTEGKALSVSPSQVAEVETAIESTRQLGRDTRQKQIAIQRAALMESLDEAGGFLRTSDDSRYATCERALQQVTHTLQRLALVWKPVMTPTALYTTLGGLVNEVLLRVLDEIEDQTDISEEESIRLNRLCKMLHDLESLFDGSETSVGREVPIWFKFVFLSELLEASMADILFLFDHGHLVDFSPQEIVRLIRALFSDSPLRNRNVEKILAGHPTVAPQEEEDEWAQF
ncbi:hypothetical protein JCM5350_005762 [Sporobolomyces pararoseus]